MNQARNSKKKLKSRSAPWEQLSPVLMHHTHTPKYLSANIDYRTHHPPASNSRLGKEGICRINRCEAPCPDR